MARTTAAQRALQAQLTELDRQIGDQYTIIGRAQAKIEALQAYRKTLFETAGAKSKS